MKRSAGYPLVKSRADRELRNNERLKHAASAGAHNHGCRFDEGTRLADGNRKQSKSL